MHLRRGSRENTLLDVTALYEAVAAATSLGAEDDVTDPRRTVHVADVSESESSTDPGQLQ